MMRLSEDRLERHEFREKALGDQLKKMLIGLDKKHRALEPLKGMISRLDDRLSNVETILLQVKIPNTLICIEYITADDIIFKLLFIKFYEINRKKNERNRHR